ncbi:MAG: ABC transporter substrate-binding protein, partial [Spirochaetes bacterium]
MKRAIFILLALALVTSGIFAEGQKEKGKVKLIYMTAGDVNMLALGQNVFGPQFQKKYPNISLVTIHTGPGNAGSQRIYEKVLAESQTNTKEWDVDVAMVHQIFMKWAMEKDLLLKYAEDLETWKYVTSPFAKTSLGVNIEGYAMPMFHSQTAL